MWPFGKKKKDNEFHEKQLRTYGLLVIVSSQCIGPNRLPVLHAVHEKPRNVSDSGWVLSSGKESTEFSGNPENYKLVPLEMMISTDDTLTILKESPAGTEITRREVAEPWRFIVNDRVVDADGKVVGDVR